MHPWTLDIAPDSRQTENISRRLVFAIGIAELACVVFYVIPRNNRFASWQQSPGKHPADHFAHSAALGPRSGCNPLMASTVCPDPPPDGPGAFDVFDDGTFLIADPLGKRLAIFDAKGKFQRELTIGLAVDDVAIMPNGLVRVRDSHTGETILFDRQGQQSTSENAAQSVRRVVLRDGN